MSELTNLEALDQVAGAAPKTPSTADVERQRHVAEVKAAMEETIKQNGAEIVKVFGTGAGNVTVEKVLCFSDSGNLIEVEPAVGQKYLTEVVPAKTEGKTVVRRKKDAQGKPILNPDYIPHKVASAPKNVGFVIKNTGSSAIEYITSKCVKGEDGQYVVNKVKATLAAGQSAPIRKGDLTALLSAPEFSFKAANGQLVPKAGSAAADISIATRLDNYTFKFATGSINDNQQQIGEKGADGKWYVRQEYIELFGDEENVKATTKSGVQTPKEDKPDASAYEANYIRQLLAKSNFGA